METDAGKRQKKVTLFAQGQYLKVVLPIAAAKQGGGARGEVSEFSRSSRKRMLEKLARIDIARAGFIAFVTLTYPDRDGPPSHLKSSRDRATFQKRIERRFPEASAIWRREWEARESGDFVGLIYPHFHLLFFNLPFIHYEEVNRIWGEVIKHDGYLRTEIKAIASIEQAFYYVSKYMAKTPATDACAAKNAIAEAPASQEEAAFSEMPKQAGFPSNEKACPESDAEAEVVDAVLVDSERPFFAAGRAPSRREGPGGEEEAAASSETEIKNAETAPASGQEATPEGKGSCSLVYVSYLTEREKEKNEKAPAKRTGRHWGIFNEKRFPFADKATLNLPIGPWLEDFRAEAGKIWPNAGDNLGYGFSLFVDAAASWLDMAQRFSQGGVQ